MVFHFPATSAIIADSLSPQNRGIGIATMNTAATLLAIFSPYIAGTLLEVYNIELGMRILYSVLLSTNLISAIINLRYLEETSTRKESFRISNITGILRDVYSGIPSVLRQLPRTIRALAIILILGFMTNGITSPFWVVYAVNQIGLSSVEWGLILLVETALRTLLNIPMGILVDRYGRTKFIILSFILSLVSIPFFVISTGFNQVFLIRIIVAVANALFIPCGSALMADAIPREIRGRTMAALGRGSFMIGATGGGTGGPGMGFLITIPMMIAFITGGFLYELNPTYPWLFAGTTIIISIVASILYIRDPAEPEI
jgi:MFS family permease